jgi:hypothetical protein
MWSQSIFSRAVETVSPAGTVQRATFAKQEAAAQQQVQLNQARAKAERQTELISSAIAVEIAPNRGQAQFAEAEQLAKKQVALAEGEARSKELIGKGESSLRK